MSARQGAKSAPSRPVFRHLDPQREVPRLRLGHLAGLQEVAQGQLVEVQADEIGAAKFTRKEFQPLAAGEKCLLQPVAAALLVPFRVAFRDPRQSCPQGPVHAFRAPIFGSVPALIRFRFAA